jgi:hypothetical protein
MGETATEEARGRRKPRIRLSYWREYVRVQADFLAHQLETAISRLSPEQVSSVEPVRNGVVMNLRKVLDIANRGITSRFPLRSRLKDAWSGASVEGAFLRLHAAEVLLMELLPEDEVKVRVGSTLVSLRASLGEDDVRLRMVDQLLEAGTDPPPRDEGHPWDAGVPTDTAGGRGRGRAGRWRSAASAGSSRPDTEGATSPADPAARRAARRAAYRLAMQAAYALFDEQQTRIRSFRNAVIMAVLMLALMVGALVAVGAWSPSTIPLCFSPGATATAQPSGQPQVSQGQQQAAVCPTGEASPNSGDVMLVAFLGLLGGGLSAALAVRQLLDTPTRHSTPIAPHTVPIALAVLKLPAGALTGVLGLMLVGGGFVPGLTALDTQEQILGYAFLLGFAQQLVTGVIDRRAREILGEPSGRDRDRELRPPTIPPPFAQTPTVTGGPGRSATP